MPARRANDDWVYGSRRSSPDRATSTDLQTARRFHFRSRRAFNVTDSPTAPWTAQQIVEAFPEDSAPRYLLRDRDNIYGCEFRRRAKGVGSAEVLTAPRSPWQNPFAERVIGTFRRELLNHVIVLNEAHLRRRFGAYLPYYKWESQCFTSVCG